MYSVLVSGDRVCGRIFSVRPTRKLGSFVQGAKASMCLALFELHSPSKVPFEVYTAVVHLLKKAVLNTHHVCRDFHQEGASPPEPSPRGRASPPGHRAFRVFPRDDAGNARRPHREGYGCAPHPMNPHRCGHTLALAFPRCDCDVVTSITPTRVVSRSRRKFPGRPPPKSSANSPPSKPS